MSLCNFIREEKGLSNQEETQMNKRYDWLLKETLELQKQIEDIEKRIHRISSPYSLCDTIIDRDWMLHRFELYNDFMKFIDGKLRTPEDLKSLLYFMDIWIGKEIYE